MLVEEGKSPAISPATLPGDGRTGMVARGNGAPAQSAAGIAYRPHPAGSDGSLPVHAPTVASIPITPELFERIGLTRPWVAVSLGAGLLAAFVLAMYVDGFQRYLGDFDFWTTNVEVPLLITYVLLMHRFLDTHTRRTIEATRQIAAVDDATYNGVVGPATARIARYQWAALALAAAFTVLMVVTDWMPSSWEWNYAISKLTILVEYFLIFSLIYLAVTRNRLLTRLYRLPVRINLFDLSPLAPMSQLSLGLAAAITGGVTISALLVGDPDELVDFQHLPIYLIALGVAVLLFYGNMSSAHHVLAQAKARELSAAREGLALAYRELSERQKSGRGQGIQALSESVLAWLAYEKRILEMPEWPYTANTLRGLYLSVLLPIILTIVQQLLVLAWLP